ncbi:MAG: AmmeMemoRadiSam system protein A [Proteobacteria bacterium]|nr:AmmeMemoRadiSam system protein A [Pseudomonadota bacterium]
MLDERERRRLIELAHESIARGARKAPAPLPPRSWSAALARLGATFTTLTLGTELRGCRGTLEAHRMLAADVWHNSWASAYDDPRFPPIAATEAASLSVVISVLTPLVPLEVRSEEELIAALEPGIDGLVLVEGAARATFLPSVWKQLPQARDFVAQLKRKAGWPSAYWSTQLRALRYRTETFPVH